MYKLKTIIRANKRGAYKAQDVIRQIIENMPQIKVPNKPLSQIALCDLSYGGKQCGKVTAEGVPGSYNRQVGEWMEREAVLYFM